MAAICMGHFDAPLAEASEFLTMPYRVAIGHEFDDANGAAWRVTWCAPKRGGWLVMVSQIAEEACAA
jgi:hypothetical protein